MKVESKVSTGPEPWTWATSVDGRCAGGAGPTGALVGVAYTGGNMLLPPPTGAIEMGQWLESNP